MINSLPKVVDHRKKRIGRGRGSGKGSHTVGRGQKGQKSRSKIGILFEGHKVKKSLFKRLPLKRGKGKLKSIKNNPIIVKLGLLNMLKDGSEVDIKCLVDAKIVRKDDAEEYGIKILGDGTLEKKLTILLPISKSASKKVEEAGGKVNSKQSLGLKGQEQS